MNNHSRCRLGKISIGTVRIRPYIVKEGYWNTNYRKYWIFYDIFLGSEGIIQKVRQYASHQQLSYISVLISEIFIYKSPSVFRVVLSLQKKKQITKIVSTEINRIKIVLSLLTFNSVIINVTGEIETRLLS